MREKSRIGREHPSPPPHPVPDKQSTIASLVMVFLAVMPVLIGGLGNYLIPIQIQLQICPSPASTISTIISFWLPPPFITPLLTSGLTGSGAGTG